MNPLCSLLVRQLWQWRTRTLSGHSSGHAGLLTSVVACTIALSCAHSLQVSICSTSELLLAAPFKCHSKTPNTFLCYSFKKEPLLAILRHDLVVCRALSWEHSGCQVECRMCPQHSHTTWNLAMFWMCVLLKSSLVGLRSSQWHWIIKFPVLVSQYLRWNSGGYSLAVEKNGAEPSREPSSPKS